MNLEKISNEVQDLSRKVGEYLEGEWRNFDREKTGFKQNFKDLVTHVDRESEERIIEGLKKVIPDAGFLAEENFSDNIPKNEYYWIIDPLDGTTNFAHGLPIFSISIALVREEEVVMGVVLEVGRMECFSAIVNGGAYCNSMPIKISSAINPKNTLSVTGFPYHDFEGFDSYMKAIKSFLRNTHGVRRLGSAAVDLCYVASGRFDAFFEIGLNPWDVAAGSLIVKEAGGIVTDFSSNNDYLFGKEIFAANKLHGELLKMFNEHWSP